MSNLKKLNDLVEQQLSKIRFGLGDAIYADRSAHEDVFEGEKPFIGTVLGIEISITKDNMGVRYFTEHDDWISEDEGHVIRAATEVGKWVLYKYENGFIVWVVGPYLLTSRKDIAMRFNTKEEAYTFREKHISLTEAGFQAAEDG